MNDCFFVLVGFCLPAALHLVLDHHPSDAWFTVPSRGWGFELMVAVTALSCVECGGRSRSVKRWSSLTNPAGLVGFHPSWGGSSESMEERDYTRDQFLTQGQNTCFATISEEKSSPDFCSALHTLLLWKFMRALNLVMYGSLARLLLAVLVACCVGVWQS